MVRSTAGAGRCRSSTVSTATRFRTPENRTNAPMSEVASIKLLAGTIGSRRGPRQFLDCKRGIARIGVDAGPDRGGAEIDFAKQRRCKSGARRFLDGAKRNRTVRRLLRHHQGRHRAPERGRGPVSRSQSRRHRDRDRHQRRSSLCRACNRGTVAGLARADGAGQQLDRGDFRHGSVRPVFRGSETRRGETVEDLQRPAPAVERTACGLRRDFICRRFRPALPSCPARSTR